jgi:hypothetical protein
VTPHRPHRLASVRPARPVVVECKRLGLPYVVTSRCPQCEREQTRDLSRDAYVSYAVLHPATTVREDDRTCTVYFSCSTCDVDWTCRFALTLTMTEVHP